MVEWSSTKEKINERGPCILVEWSFAKEIINERGRYMLVEWTCENKRNKSTRTIILGQMVVRKRKNKWKKTIYFGRMVVSKGRNKWRGTLYIWVEWSCANKRNKSMKTASERWNVTRPTRIFHGVWKTLGLPILMTVSSLAVSFEEYDRGSLSLFPSMVY